MRSIYAVTILIGLMIFSAIFNFIQPHTKAAREIVIERTPEETPIELPWNLNDKIAEADEILSKIELKVGVDEIPYSETLISHFPVFSKPIVRRKEQEKEIALAILNIKTGDIKTVIVTKHGDKLVVPNEYEMSINERSNGIRWNRWNTDYKVPEGFIVIRNSYPELTGAIEKKTVLDSRGRKKTVYQPKVEYVLYTPYSPALHSPEMVTAGKIYINNTVAQAYNNLKKNKVLSRFDATRLVADLTELEPKFFEALPLIEQTDMTEFILDPERTFGRVHVIIGTNQTKAFSKTGSVAGALGWVQFTKRTYDTIRRLYPNAGLMKDFKLGAADHLNSMTASILLYDYNLAQFKHKFGSDALQGQRLEEYLAAAYNGGTSRIADSLHASISGQLNDWTGKLKQETKGYILKLRTIRASEG